MQADEADALKLRTAALKLRLGQLAWERRSREAAEASAFEAKQRELDRCVGRRCEPRVARVHASLHAHARLCCLEVVRQSAWLGGAASGVCTCPHGPE